MAALLITRSISNDEEVIVSSNRYCLACGWSKLSIPTYWLMIISYLKINNSKLFFGGPTALFWEVPKHAPYLQKRYNVVTTSYDNN